tara:strand:+ start:244 stop:849 length:606 start_codon:yes stop_codon:yes gene_type:complete
MTYSKKRSKNNKKTIKKKMHKGSGPKRARSVSPPRSTLRTSFKKPPRSTSIKTIKLIEINLSLMDNYNFKILYNKRKHLPLEQLDLFINSNIHILKKIDEDFIVNIINDDTMLTNIEYYKKLDILVHLYILMDTTGDFDDIYEKIKELENLKEEIQIKNPIGIADGAKKLEKNKKKYNIMINDIQEEYIELILQELSDRGQ